jgi:hypothetical protein
MQRPDRQMALTVALTAGLVVYQALNYWFT